MVVVGASLPSVCEIWRVFWEEFGVGILERSEVYFYFFGLWDCRVGIVVRGVIGAVRGGRRGRGRREGAQGVGQSGLGEQLESRMGTCGACPFWVVGILGSSLRHLA